MLTAIGLKPGGSNTVHIFTQTTYRTTQLTILFGRLFGIRTQTGQTKINDELRKNYRLMGRVRAVPRLRELYPGICLTAEEKSQKNLSQGSRRVPVIGKFEIMEQIFALQATEDDHYNSHRTLFSKLINIYIHIQGVPRVKVTTSGECSLC